MTHDTEFTEASQVVRTTISEHERFRRKAGLGVTEMAQRLGFSHAYVSQIESGRIRPSKRYRRAVADLFCLAEEWIFDDEQ